MLYTWVYGPNKGRDVEKAEGDKQTKRLVRIGALVVSKNAVAAAVASSVEEAVGLKKGRKEKTESTVPNLD